MLTCEFFVIIIAFCQNCLVSVLIHISDFFIIVIYHYCVVSHNFDFKMIILAYQINVSYVVKRASIA